MRNKRKIEVSKLYQRKWDNACGPKCIAMAWCYHKKKKRPPKEVYKRILELTMKGNILRERGTSTEEMKAAVRGMGLRCKKIPGNMAGLTKPLKRGNPVIALCCMQAGRKRYRHYIVIVGQNKDKKYLYINDPYPDRPQRVSLSNFFKRGQELNWGGKRWGIEVFRN